MLAGLAEQVNVGGFMAGGGGTTTVVQAAGIPAVTVSGPPKVNFTVFSGGAVKADLALSNVSFAIAKLVTGATASDPDQWVNYIYRKETATAGVGPRHVRAHGSRGRCARLR